MLSVDRQTVPPRDVIYSHSEDLQSARNKGAARTDVDWLIFLDADDELHPNYIEAMLKGEGDVRYPSSLAVQDEVYPIGSGGLPQETDLLKRNFIVIGAMVRKSLFNEVNGFGHYKALEDWDFWLKCYFAGADIQPCQDAIYYIHVNPNSRNQDTKAVRDAGVQIRKKYRKMKRP